MDHLDDEVKQFFLNAKRSRPEIRELDFQRIKNEYKKVLEDADEKFTLATQMYDLVDKYLRRLDQELDKFKTELEADNAGITEILERRSHELDNHPTNHSSHHLSSQQLNHAVRKKFNMASTAVRQGMSSLYGHNPMISAAAGPPNGSQSFNPHFSASSSSSAIPLTLYNANIDLQAAASQAIAATNQMSSGRRTASLKASIDAINLGGPLGSLSGFNEPFQSSFSGLDASASSNRGNKRNRSSSQFHDSGMFGIISREKFIDHQTACLFYRFFGCSSIRLEWRFSSQHLELRS